MALRHIDFLYLRWILTNDADTCKRSVRRRVFGITKFSASDTYSCLGCFLFGWRHHSISRHGKREVLKLTWLVHGFVMGAFE